MNHPNRIPDLNGMLLEAMNNHNLKLAALLIRHGADPNSFWNDNPIMQYGILDGSIELVRYALLHGANARLVDRDGDRMLHLAVEESFFDAAQILLKYDDVNSADANGNTTIFYALKDPKYNMLDLLLQAGASVNVCNIQGDTPLHMLLNRRPTTWAARKLLSHGADVNFRNHAGQSPLDIALHRANLMVNGFYTALVVELLNWGATINDSNKIAFLFLVSFPKCSIDLVNRFIQDLPELVHATDQFNCTPLHYAVQGGRLDVVQVLIMSGAKVNAVDNDGCTPLHYAVSHELVIKELILKGAEVDRRNHAHQTALHMAAKAPRNLSSGPVWVLLFAGADTHATDIDGKTPFAYVCHSPRNPAMPVLLQYSIFENYLEPGPYPHDKHLWLDHAHFFVLPLIQEIESMKGYNVADQVNLFNVLMEKDWDMAYAHQIFSLMNPHRFPYYWDVILARLSLKVEKFMKDSNIDVQRFIRGLSRQSNFVTNTECFLHISQYLSTVDCLNLLVAGSNSSISV